MPKKICVILPTLNEEKAVAKVIKELPNPTVSRVIVLDGYSSDRTVDIAKTCRPTLDVDVIFQKGKGKGMAFQTFLNDFDLNNYDIYVMLDADYTYNPRELKHLIWPILNGEADVVVGNRFAFKEIRQLMPFTTYLGNKLLTFVASILYFKNPKDVCTGYWAFSREYLKRAKIKAKNFDLEANLFTEAIKRNYRIKIVPITYRTRVGKNKLMKRDGIVILFRLVKEFFYN
jgi:dolichol-phosphate mannosyltransferase